MLQKLTSIAKKAIRKLRPAATVRCCPICNWQGSQFSTGGAGDKQRIDARCQRCGSLERHRLAYLVAEQRLTLDYSRVVHVAPEAELSAWLQRKSGHYVSIDLYANAMMKMDITDLQFDDASQSLIWASHVLEHVVDDHKAITEMYRVLAPGGKALIQVPVWRVDTFEDPTATSAQRRSELFYQSDHVRLYGLDIVDRFISHGFSAETHRAQDFGPTLLLRHGLSFASTDEVFVFTK